jgi:DNA-binding NarL/FixJ family response regulator
MQRRGVIVVVDPDDRTRSAVREVAARSGCDLVAFDDATTLMTDVAGEHVLLAVVEVDLAGEMNGYEVLGALRDHFGRDLPVIFVSSTRTEPTDRVAGLMLGADDYVLKPFDCGEFRARLRRSLARTDPPTPEVIAPAEGLHLSEREREILALLAAGHSQDEIATELFISPKTVATHIQHVLLKLNVRSRAQAVAAAYRLGVAIPPDDGSSRP